MRGTYRRCLGRLLGGGALLYAGIMALLAGLLILWANFLAQENTLSGPLAYLAQTNGLALPLLAMDAYARDRRLGLDKLYRALPVEPGRLQRGAALAYLTAFLFSCAPLALMAALVLPQSDTWAGLAGYVASQGALLCGCLLMASRVKGRLAAFGLGLALTQLSQNAAWLAGLLDQWALGAKAGRLLLYLSPSARLNAFLNGALDLPALGYCLALGALLLYLMGRGGWKRGLKGAALWAAAALALAWVPACVGVLDLTPQQVTTPTQRMELLLSGLNRPVTVYQVAPVGEEDAWVWLYLKKLGERHPNLTAQLISPREDPDIASLDLPANSLVVEEGEQWAVLRYDTLYQTHSALEGQQATFELEGALLTALDEVTGLTMSQLGVPAGPRLDQTYTLEEEARRPLTLGLVLGPALLLAAWAVLALKRKRYEKAV